MNRGSSVPTWHWPGAPVETEFRVRFDVGLPCALQNIESQVIAGYEGSRLLLPRPRRAARPGHYLARNAAARFTGGAGYLLDCGKGYVTLPRVDVRLFARG